jgi:hypothetical protein
MSENFFAFQIGIIRMAILYLYKDSRYQFFFASLSLCVFALSRLLQIRLFVKKFVVVDPVVDDQCDSYQ